MEHFKITAERKGDAIYISIQEDEKLVIDINDAKRIVVSKLEKQIVSVNSAKIKTQIKRRVCCKNPRAVKMSRRRRISKRNEVGSLNMINENFNKDAEILTRDLDIKQNGNMNNPKNFDGIN